MPSHDETFGLVALEAMFLRKLLVASDRGGLAEFVDPRCAIVVQPDDVGSIAAGLRRALAMLGTPQGREMIARAHERAVSYHPAQIATELEAIYQEIDNIRHGAPPRAHSPA
jgi:glycosyltransferase involved in cell wall biosynthesis